MLCPFYVKIFRRAFHTHIHFVMLRVQCWGYNFNPPSNHSQTELSWVTLWIKSVLKSQILKISEQNRFTLIPVLYSDQIKHAFFIYFPLGLYINVLIELKFLKQSPCEFLALNHILDDWIKYPTYWLCKNLRDRQKRLNLYLS